MKDDKICFSKTFTYLVLLIAAVAGAFWVMNYTNTQKLGANPKADSTTCNSLVMKRVGGKLQYQTVLLNKCEKRIYTSSSGKETEVNTGRKCAIVNSKPTIVDSDIVSDDEAKVVCPLPCIYGEMVLGDESTRRDGKSMVYYYDSNNKCIRYSNTASGTSTSTANKCDFSKRYGSPPQTYYRAKAGTDTSCVDKKTVSCTLNGKRVMLSDENYKLKGSYYMSLYASDTLISSSYGIWEYVDGKKDKYSGYVCRPVYDNSGVKEFSNIVRFNVASEERQSSDVTGDGSTVGLGNDSLTVCQETMAPCVSSIYDITNRVLLKSVRYGVTVKNSASTSYKCGCDGVNRYSVLIKQ